MPRLTPIMYSISPEYFHAAGTALLAGRTFTWHDDKNAPRVAVVNREFASKIFGSATRPWADITRCRMERASKWWALWKTENIPSLTEDPQPAMFLPILQSPSSDTWLVVRSNRDPQQLAAAIRSTLRDLDRGSRLHPNVEQEWTSLCFLRAWQRCRWECWA